MRWTALVPLKGGDARKSRLAGRLTPEQRFVLSEAMARHVLECLAGMGAIARVETLSPAPVAEFVWHRDEGRGLNAELTAYRAAHPDRPLLVIHGDLPLLTGDEVGVLLAAGEAAGGAIAPDRHGTGTNALALYRPGPFAFAFGAGSCAAHARAMTGATIIRLAGLSLDVDSPDDLVVAREAGFGLDEAQSL